MSADNFQNCLTVVLKLEGGWVNNPLDRGGPTNLGVTLGTWQTWVGKSRVVTALDIERLTEADVAPLYQRVFWRGSSCEYLPAGIDLATVDWSINSGVREGNIGLQRALGVPVDGLIGPVTINAAAAADHAALVDAICDERLAFMKALPIWEEFGHGWSNRVASIRVAAKAMIAA